MSPRLRPGVARCLVLALLSVCAVSHDTTAATTTTGAATSRDAQPATTTTTPLALPSAAAVRAVVDRWRADYRGVPGAAEPRRSVTAHH